MTDPLAAIVLAERLLALGEGVYQLVEVALEAVEQRKADRARYFMGLAAQGTSAGQAAHLAATLAGPRKS
jgi:hypothetical protein